LKNYGVEEIEAKEGDEFNPELHEAIKQESGGVNQELGNKIKKVMQKGYRLNGRVMRPVKAVVE